MDDVLEEGRRTYGRIEAFGWDVLWHSEKPVPDDAWPIDIIARAIRAERERCADTVLTLARVGFALTENEQNFASLAATTILNGAKASQTGGWQSIDSAPKDGTEVMLWYRDFCGEPNLVVSGHWECEEGREFEATWTHSFGYGDADMWKPLPPPPAA